MYFVFFAMKCRNRFIEHSLQLSVNTCLQYCKKRQRLSNTIWLWNFSLCFEIGDLEKEMYFVDLGDLGDRRSWLSWRLLIFGYLGDHRSWRRLQNEPVACSPCDRLQESRERTVQNNFNSLAYLPTSFQPPPPESIRPYPMHSDAYTSEKHLFIIGSISDPFP